MILAHLAEQIGPGLRTISAGGGLPIPYREDEPRLDIVSYADVWTKTRQGLESKLGRSIELEIEPGR